MRPPAPTGSRCWRRSTTRTPGTEDNLVFTIGYRVTDGEGVDGDTADGTLSISIDDDSPTTSSTHLVVDEDDLASGNNDSAAGDDAPANVTGLWRTAMAPTARLDQPAAGSETVNGVLYTYTVAGNVLTANDGTQDVFTVTLTDAATGAYSVALLAAIDHPIADTEDNLGFTIGYRATDGDGDTADGMLAISIDDDSPTTSSNLTVVVDEDDLASGNNDSAAGDDAPANVTGLLAHSYGADQPGSISLLAGSETVNGVLYTYTVAGNVLTANDGTQDVFTVTLTDAATGAYSVALLAAIDHPIAGTEDNLAFTIGYRATDGDGDTADGTLVDRIDDDTPTVTV